MIDMKSAIRVTVDRQRNSGVKIGCLLALLMASANSAAAQVVSAAGDKPAPALGASGLLIANESTRVANRRVLMQFPQETQRTDVIPGAETVLAPGGRDAEASATTPAQRRGITPAQSADLSLTAEPVNIDTATIGTGVLPEDTAAMRAPASSGLLDGQSRGFPAMLVNWQPAAICHLPLYFEDAMLERHGHVRWGHAQPIVSGAKFLTTLPLLPYLKTMQPPCEPRYTLGHFRPGSCAPALRDHLPWDRRAATVETLSLGAFFWAAPL